MSDKIEVNKTSITFRKLKLHVMRPLDIIKFEVTGRKNRNLECQCGSGNKYKNCCMKIVGEVIKSRFTIPSTMGA